MAYPSVKLISDKNIRRVLEYLLKNTKVLQNTVEEINTNVEEINDTIEPTYKVYNALLTQTGTSAPTVTVLENTLGVVPTLSYIGVGEYGINATGIFVTDKTTVQISNKTATVNIGGSWRDANQVRVYTSDTSHTPANATLAKTSIEIKVYN